MPTVHIVTGATGAGKTTYAMRLAREIGAVRFSIDPWMHTLFAPDMKALSFDWMTERIRRCEAQIWHVAEQVLSLGSDVVLDLGFDRRAHRDEHAQRARAAGAAVRVHFLDVSAVERRRRVLQRNQDRDPAVFTLEVTAEMFDFMEGRFEPPDADELKKGVHLTEGD